MPLIVNPREALQLSRKQRPKRIPGNRASKAISKQLESILMEQVNKFAFDANDPGFWNRAAPDVLADVIDRKLQATNRLDAKTRSLVREWINAISTEDKIRLERKIARAVNVKTLQIVDTPELEQTLIMMNYEANVSLDSIVSDYFNGVQLAVSRNYEGLPHPAGRSFVEQIQFLEHHAYERCKGMSRDQTNKVHAVVTQERQTGIGIEEYIWRTSRDIRVVGTPGGPYVPTPLHGNHYQREGKRYRWDNPPKDGHPGWPINCLLDESRVGFPHGCNKLWRRKYSGSVFALTTESGRVLKGTPNHPVLTGRGWLPLNDVQEGDYIIQIGEASGIGEVYNNETSPRFMDVWDTLQQSFGATACGTGLNFHGEKVSGDVHVIDVDLLLRGANKAGITHSLKQLGFKRPERTSALPGIFSAQGGMNLFSISLTAAFNRFMRRFRKTAPFFFGSFCHTQEHSFALATQSNTVFFDDALDRPARSSESFRNGFNGMPFSKETQDFVDRHFELVVRNLSSNVFTHDGYSYEVARVDRKNVEQYHGYAYTPEVPQGYYIGDSFVNHNCRCYAEPILVPDKLKLAI